MEKLESSSIKSTDTNRSHLVLAIRHHDIYKNFPIIWEGFGMGFSTYGKQVDLIIINKE